MAGSYFNAPGGQGAWWVGEGEDPWLAQALQNVQQTQNTTIDSGAGQGTDWLRQYLSTGGVDPKPSAPTDPRMASPNITTSSPSLSGEGEIGVAQRPTPSGELGAQGAIAQAQANMPTLPGQGGQPLPPAGTRMASPTPTTSEPTGTYGRTTPETGQFNPQQAYIEELLGGIPEIPGIELPENPQISPTFGTEVTEMWNRIFGQGGQAIAQAYESGDWPTMRAALMNMGDIPNPQAQQVGGNAALDHLLSGKGFSDDVLTKMRANATDQYAQAGAAQRAAGQRAAGNAGLGNSGLGIALGNQAARDQLQNTGQAMNNIDIENAMQGIQNLRLGAPMELQRGSFNAQQANQMALANAANVFAGMQQNVSNSQQAAGVNTANAQERQMGRAGTQANFAAGNTGDFLSQILARANTADTGNVDNTINRNLNQAQLNRQQHMFNTNLREGRYGNALNQYMAAASGANPAPYYTAGANMIGQPNYGYSNTLSNTGQGLLTLNQRR